MWFLAVVSALAFLFSATLAHVRQPLKEDQRDRCEETFATVPTAEMREVCDYILEGN